jgi:hypothetical protein
MKQVTADMQQVYATAGLSGMRRFMVDQITNPQLDFDVLLKMAFFRAVLYGADRLNSTPLFKAARNGLTQPYRKLTLHRVPLYGLILV